MRKAIIVGTFLALAPAAQAQPAPAFVPYQISEQEHQAILNALGPLPWAQANPLVQFFVQAEQKAILAEDAKKKAAAAPAEKTAPRPGLPQ